MKILGICLWHRWKTKSIYYDCSDICIWSSGTVTYRECKDCGVKQERRWNEEEWSESTTEIDWTKGNENR